MPKYKLLATVLLPVMLLSYGCSHRASGPEKPVTGSWQTDFFDDFDSFDNDNWQDQMIWVNNEFHCYVPDNQFGTREVNAGSLKIRVVNVGELQTCNNLDKHGKQHPDTQTVAGRIVGKNRQEFV